MNITIRAIKDEDGTGGRLVISGQDIFYREMSLLMAGIDTGIGMTPEELTANLVRLQ